MQTVFCGQFKISLKPVGRVLYSCLRAIIVLAPAIALPGPADAQGVDCTQLQSQLAAGPQGNPQAAARYAAAVRTQQAELDRTAAYAQQLGCNNRQFLFFGSPPPPQCGGIEQQMKRMGSKLAQLQAQQRSVSGEAQRQALLARYDTYCRQRRGNFIESLFGGPSAPTQQQSLDDPALAPPPEDTTPRGGAKAVCVRSCDGGFFPVSYSARRGNNDDLEELCHALCPNAETQLFTYSLSGDIDQAVSNDGTPYKSMPNAFRYRTKFDPACTCKPPNMSWVQALANAESLLGRSSKSDIMVTEQKSAELSRPVQARATTTPARGKAAAPAKPDDDPTIAAEAAANANSPTAGNSSAGIAAGTAAGAKTYGLTDGQSRVDVDANGVRRRVRVVGPTL